MEKIKKNKQERLSLSERSSHRYLVSVMSLVFLNAADIISTRLSLNKGGIEGNPFAQDIVESDALMIATKAVYIAMALFVLDKISKKYGNSRSAEMVLLVTNLFY